MHGSKDRSFLHRALREPVLHFLFLGCLVFAANARFGTRPAGAPMIVADEGVRTRLSADVRRRTGRAPTEPEVARAVDEWLDDEVLFQRALALSLHRTDLVVRRELVQRMRFLLEDAGPIPEPTDEELVRYLEAHPNRFAARPRFSFEHIFFSRGSRGSRLESDASAALAALRADPHSNASGDPFFGGSRVAEASPEAVERSFGRGFSDALAELPLGHWAGPVRSGFGVHVVRVSAVIRSAPRGLEAVRTEVSEEVRDEKRESENRRALDVLRAEFGLAPARKGSTG